MVRLEVASDGKMTFKSGAQRVEARLAVVLAHDLLLRVLMSQSEHFSLGLESDLKKNLEDFQQAYPAGQTSD
jgi:hypothetical protein